MHKLERLPVLRNPKNGDPSRHRQDRRWHLLAKGEVSESLVPVVEPGQAEVGGEGVVHVVVLLGWV